MEEQFLVADYSALDRSIRRAGLLIAAGLAVEIVATAFIHPFAFIAFLLVACPLILAGMFLFLWALVASS